VENFDEMKSLNKTERKKIDKFIDKLYDRLDKSNINFRFFYQIDLEIILLNI
jgi:hypothetical protein